jgi:YD repeat-containing protein
MAGHPDGLYSRTFVGETGWKEGLPLATEDCIGTNCAQQKRWTWTDYTQDNIALTYILNPRVKEARVGDSANVKETAVEYHMSGSSTTVANYGLVKKVEVGDLSTVIKRVETDYLLTKPYTDRNIIGLPSETRAWGKNDLTNNLEQVSRVTYGYDEGTFSQEPNQIITPTRHDTANYGSAFTKRGNPTSTTRWEVPNNVTSVTSQVRYDIAGSPVAQIDPLGRKVRIGYADNFQPTQSFTTFAYPTVITDPAGSSLGDALHSSTVKYRYDIGANVEASSPAPAGNTLGKKTTRLFDTYGRLEKETIVNSGAYTRYEYPTNGIQSKVFSTIIDTNNNGADALDEVMSESWSDGAGRVRRSRTEHPGSSGGWSGSIVEYDILGRAKRQSVPTEVSVPNANDPDTWAPAGDDLTRGFLWTYQKYDWNGRVVRKNTTDGTDSPTLNDSDVLISYEGCGCAGGQQTTIEAERVPVPGTSNFARRKQKVYEDILGRAFKTEVMNWDGSVYSTTQESFNGRDQVLKRSQFDGPSGSGTYRDVLMTFDGHGRMKTRHYPIENVGANTTWNYNTDDTIQNVTDPRGVVTSFGYNSRAMTESIFYDPGSTGVADTPDVAFAYDNAGNRTSMTDGTGNTSYVYDSLSRITSETKYITELNQSFTINYTYAMNGAVQTFTDPQDSARTAEYTFDKIGRTTQTRNSYSGVEKQKLQETQYRAWGALKKHTFVNIGVAGSIIYPVEFNHDNRLQVSSYAALYPPNPNGVTFAVNYARNADGKVNLSTDTVLPSFTRNFEYDHVGRVTKSLSGAAIHGIPQTDTPYRTTIAYNSFSEPTSIAGKHWEVSNVSHLPTITLTTGRDPTSVYDAAGNIAHERMRTTPTILNRIYGYDAGGRNTSVFDPALRTTETDKNSISTFDGNGWRVKAETTQGSSWTKKFEISSTVLGGETVGSWEFDNFPPTPDIKKFISSANGVKMTYNSQATFWEFEWLSPDGTTMYAGGSHASEEFDARGAALGIENPYSGGGGYGGGGGFGDAEHYARCEWGGLSISCGMADRLHAAEVRVNQDIERRTGTPSRHLAYEPKYQAPEKKAKRDNATAPKTQKTDKPQEDTNKGQTVNPASVPDGDGKTGNSSTGSSEEIDNTIYGPADMRLGGSYVTVRDDSSVDASVSEGLSVLSPKDPCDISDLARPSWVSLKTNVATAERRYLGTKLVAGAGGLVTLTTATIPGVGIAVASISAATTALAAKNHANWFRSMVNDGGKWDYKSLTTITELKSGKSIWEKFGNFHYGVVGAAAGFDRGKTIQRMAGHNQDTKGEVGGGGEHGGMESIIADFLANRDGGEYPYRDEIADQELIERGRSYYYAGCHNK